MKRVSSWNATSVLCALLLGACAGSAASPAKPEAAAVPEKTQTADPGLQPDADLAAVLKDLPTSLDGEIRRAQLLRSKGDLDDASHALAQLMLVAPDDSRVIAEYGKVLVQQGQAKAALPFLDRATQLQPKDWTLFSALGVAYDQANDHAHARLAYEHALQLSPNQPAVLNNLAVSRMQAGDLAGAQHLLAQASSAGASNPKIIKNSEILASMKGPAVTHKPAPAPEKVAATSPKTVSAPTDKKAAPREAVASPRPLSSAVVMQTVPVDPMAGPVKPRVPKHTRYANAAKPKSAGPAAPPPPPPALRTAAEAN
jgi:Flp pilus assembly protein TadD